MCEKLSKKELLRDLCLTFGPSGCEDPVAKKILENIDGCYDSLIPNRTSGVIAKICGNSKGGALGTKKLMLSCHMDEVGFMIKGINDDGTLKIASMCGPDTRIMASRRVTVGNKEKQVRGVFGVKPIHLVKRDDMENAISIDEMYIDIGAADKEEAEKYVSVGDFATFESDFVSFGQDGRMIKAKAIDDRAGCAIMCDLMKELYPIKDSIPFDMYFAFTCREELGISGARSAAHITDPDHALIFESTAVADICEVPSHTTVAKQGDGPAISLMDRSTIYDADFNDLIFKVGREKDIPCQIKKYVSGGNDAGHIHKSRAGVKCAVMSIPSRYIHTASNVIRESDFHSTYRLALETIKSLMEGENSVKIQRT